MWHTGWFSTYSQESNGQKNQHEQFGTQNRAAQLSLARRGQRHRWTGHNTVRKNSNPLNTSMKKFKKRYKEKKGPTLPKKWKLWNSPAIRRRCTSWSSFRATGWSHGSVRAQALSSSWVQRLNMARRHSWPIGRWHNIFNISNNMAIGTEYKTMDCKELTILTGLTDQTGMSSHRARNGI